MTRVLFFIWSKFRIVEWFSHHHGTGKNDLHLTKRNKKYQVIYIMDTSVYTKNVREKDSWSYRIDSHARNNKL